MKQAQRYFLILLLSLPALQLWAQGIGVGTTAPDASAALDIVSSSKGALLPRIAEATRTTLGSPAPGLIVYQADGSQPGFWYNAGGTGVAPSPPVKWVRLTDSAGLSYDPATGLTIGPAPVTPFTGGTLGQLGTGTFSALPFAGAVPDGRVVYLYRAADLLAAGLSAGLIRQVELHLYYKGSSAPFNNFTLRMGLTAAGSVSALPTGLSAVYSGNYSTGPGWNPMRLTTPFAWDGTSNLLIEFCYDNSVGSNYDYVDTYTVPYNSTVGYADAGNAVPGCSLTSGSAFVAPAPNRVPVLRLSQTLAGSYSLPATGGTPGQVLVQQANGTVQWDSQLWLEHLSDVYRPYGSVGIGTTAPTERLQVEAGSVSINGEYVGLIVDAEGAKRTGLLKYTGRYPGLWRTAGSYFEIGRTDPTVTSLPGYPASFTTDMVFDGQGNVGIGTYGPSSRFEVVGSGYTSTLARIRVRSTDDQAGIGLLSNNTGEAIIYSPNGSDDMRMFLAGIDRLILTPAGNVHVNGTLSKAAGSFRIDHPQDPANKYLVHSFVESPDMMNVYNGNVTTDAQGLATVQLPAYFEAENKDFRYQLTVVGEGFAQTRVARRIAHNQFVIATDKPGVEVSWQVTGVRNDPYAQQHRLVDVVEKAGPEKGKYLTPELYGRPASEGIYSSPATMPASPRHD